MSRVEELLPSGWSYPKIKDVIKKFQNGYAFSATGYVNSGIPIITMGSIQLDGNFKKDNKKIKYWEESTREELSRYIIEKESLIMAMTDVTPTMELIGRSCIVKGEGEFYLNQRVGWIDTDENKVSKDFLSYLTNYTDWRNYCITSSGLAAQANLSTVQILEGRVKLPPLEQQQKIAKILSTVDNLIEKTQTLIDKYTAIKQGMMADLFTRGIDMTTGDTPNSKGGKLRPSVEDAPELYKQTELGWVPRDWEVDKANDICLEVIDCKNRTPPETEEGFIVLKTFNIKQGGLKYERLTFTDTESYEIWTERGKPQAGDIVITREAPIGESFLIDMSMPKMCLGQRMMLYRPDSSKIEPSFMYYVTRTETLQRRLIELAGGSTVGHVKVGDIRDLLFLIPPINEQVLIANNLGALDLKLSQEGKYLEKLKKQKKGLMQDLLTGKVKVS